MALFCSVREFMAFTSDVLVERTTPGQRQSVREQGICFAIILHFSLSQSIGVTCLSVLMA